MGLRAGPPSKRFMWKGAKRHSEPWSPSVGRAKESMLHLCLRALLLAAVIAATEEAAAQVSHFFIRLRCHPRCILVRHPLILSYTRWCRTHGERKSQTDLTFWSLRSTALCSLSNISQIASAPRGRWARSFRSKNLLLPLVMLQGDRASLRNHRSLICLRLQRSSLCTKCGCSCSTRTC